MIPGTPRPRDETAVSVPRMLTRLYVHNYRCFINFELRPGRTGLLLGYNGTGKSSIFDVLAAIQDLVVRNEEASDAFGSDTLSTLGDGGARQRFELDIDSPHGPMRYALVIDHNVSEETSRILSEEVTVSGERVYWFEQGRVHLAGPAPVDVKEFPFTSDRSFLASMDAVEPATSLQYFMEFVQDIWIIKLNPQQIRASARRDEAWLGRDGANFSAWCRHALLEEREAFQEAERTLMEVIPSFRALMVQTAGRARVLVARFARGGGKPYDLDFDRLSDGQRCLIILYVLLHVVGHRTSVLCLDEPDNFVSIREIQPFLVEMGDAMGATSFQTLVVSHASEVIDFFGPTEALLLERPEGGATRVGEVGKGTTLRLSELMARGWHGKR